MANTTDPRKRAAGLWLATGAAVLAAALVLHGPPDPDPAVQMAIIAEGHLRWSSVHWAASIALSLFATAGLMMMSGTDTAGGFATRSGWAVLTLGALWTMTTAVSEATALTQTAMSGDLAQFKTWSHFAEGKANGFMALACAVVLIAATDARGPSRYLPRWAGSAGSVVAALSAIGWILDSWLSVAIGGPVWVISSLLMCLWLVWYGWALASKQPAA